jgi:hypothetical protein
MTHIWFTLAHLTACSGEFTPNTTTTFTTETSTSSVTTETGTYTTTETAINPDADGDGFISTAFGGDDCDDDNPDINPWTLDTTLTDRNCDGILNVDLARTDYWFLGTEESDKAGTAIGPAGDVDGDGLGDVLISAGFAGTANAGEIYLVHGVDLDHLGKYYLHDSAVTISGAENEYAAEAVSGAGDIDSDGLDDIFIGSPYNTEEDYLAGKAVLFLGKSLPAQGDRHLVDADISIYGTAREQYVGQALSNAGDVDGDGVSDLLVGASGYDESRGAVGFYSGAGLSAGSLAIDDADSLLTGDIVGASAGQALDGAGDVNGDGRGDILIGAPSYALDGLATGMSYLVYGSSLDGLSEFGLQNADHSFRGDTSGDNSGTAVSTAGDVDNDGKSDLLIGAYLADDPNLNGGNSYLFLGASLFAPGAHMLADSDYLFTSEASDHYAGYALSTAGDVDANGHDDILIGAINADGDEADAGRAYLLYGETLGATREISLSEASHILIGENGQDRVGTTVSNAGDVDGDGFADLMIGAEQYDEKESDTGKVYLIMGAPQIK